MSLLYRKFQSGNKLQNIDAKSDMIKDRGQYLYNKAHGIPSIDSRVSDNPLEDADEFIKRPINEITTKPLSVKEPKPRRNKQALPSMHLESNSEKATSSGNSYLEQYINLTMPGKSIDKALSLLGNMAEAESFKGKKEYNKDSSASGIFHILVGDGGGYSKEGKKKTNGRYNEDGDFKSSSFQTAQQRLRSMVNDNNTANQFKGGMIKKVRVILSATNPDQLTKEEQGILAIANLQGKGNRFRKYMDDEIDGSEVYINDWVTLSGSHSREEILTNWRNAKIRSKNEGTFDIKMIKSFFDLGKK